MNSKLLKNQGFKRIFCLLLAVMLLLSSLPVSSLATVISPKLAGMVSAEESAATITAKLADDSYDAEKDNAVTLGENSAATITMGKEYTMDLAAAFPEGAAERKMTVILQEGLQMTDAGMDDVVSEDHYNEADKTTTTSVTYTFENDNEVPASIQPKIATTSPDAKNMMNAVEVVLSYKDGVDASVKLTKLTINAPQAEPAPESQGAPSPNMGKSGLARDLPAGTDPLEATLLKASDAAGTDDVVLTDPADTTPAEATMTMSGNLEKAYDLRTVATFPASASDRVVTITLAEGLRMIDDGSTTGDLSTYLDDDPENEESARVAAPFGLSADMKGSGTTTYRIKAGVTSVQIDTKIVADNRYWLDRDITDAIVIKSDYTDATSGATSTTREVNKLTVNYGEREFFEYIGNYKQSFALGKAIEIQKNYTYVRISESHDAAVAVFYKELTAVYTISQAAYDSGVRIINTGADPNWKLQEPDPGNGTFTFVYQNGNPGQKGGSWTVPVGIVFPATEDLAHPVPDTVTVSRDEKATFSHYPERQAVDWNTKNTSRTPGTYTFNRIKDPATPFVNYLNVDHAVNNTTTNTTTSGATSETMSGPLGYYTIGNKGGSATGAVTIKLSFDAENIGVKSLNIPIPYYDVNGNAVYDGSGLEPLAVTKIRYKLIGDNTPRTATVNFKAESVIDQGRYVSLKDLGLTGDLSNTYLSEIEYDLPFIPASTVLGFGTEADQVNNFYGVTFNTKTNPDQVAQSTITLSSNENTSEFESITGEIKSDHSKNALYISSIVSTKSIQMVNAGEVDKALNFLYRVEVPPTSLGNFGRRSYGTENPTLYIRSETGNPLSKIVLTSIQGGKSNVIPQTTRGSGEQGYILEDATNDFPPDPAHPKAKIYRISTEQLTKGQAAVSHRSTSDDGAHSNKFLTLSFNIATKLDDEGRYNYGDMMFMEASKAINGFNANDTGSVKVSMAQSWKGANKPFGIGSNNDKTLYGLPSENAGYYQIDKRTDISVDVQAKHIAEPESSYTNWSAGDDPVPIGIGTNSAMDIRLQVKNNTGLAVDTATQVYMPLPQKGEKWGKLLYSDNTEDYKNNPEFSLRFKDTTSLTGPIAAPAGTTVHYGKITPTDSETQLQKATFESWNPDNAADYNCIKIVVDSMAVDQTLNFDFKVTVKQDQTLRDGMENAWSPYYFQDLTNIGGGNKFAGWKQGSYIASEIATGELQGEIWQDFSDNAATDKNGYKDEDNKLTIQKGHGWKITLYEVGKTDPVRESEIGIVGIDNAGNDILQDNKYHFYDIPFTDENGKSIEYYMVVTNPDNTKNIFTKIIAENKTDGDKAANKAAGNVADNHATATISKVFSAQPGSDGQLAENAGRYNIGILPLSEPTKVQTTLEWVIREGDSAKGTLTAIGGTNPTAGLPYAKIHTLVSVSNNSAYYRFTGWTTDSNGTTATIAPAGPFGDNGTYGHDDTTYYAVFSKIPAKNVIYDKGTNTDVVGDQLIDNNSGEGYLENEVVTTKANTGTNDDPQFTKTGYTFKSWLSDVEVTKTDNTPTQNLLPGDTFKMPTQDVTLTPVFEPNQWTLAYDDGLPDELTVNDMPTNGGAKDYNANIKVPNVSPQVAGNTGYVFDGWSVAGLTGKTEIAPGESFTMPNNNVTLTARWKVKIIFDKGENGTLTATSAYTDENGNYAIWVGYGSTWGDTFGGEPGQTAIPTVNCNAGYETKTPAWDPNTPAASATITAPATYVAQRQPVIYDLTYEQGLDNSITVTGMPNPATTNETYNTVITTNGALAVDVSVTDYAKYSHKGWKSSVAVELCEADGTPLNKTTNDIAFGDYFLMPNSDVTLTAKWNVVITFNEGDHGSLSGIGYTDDGVGNLTIEVPYNTKWGDFFGTVTPQTALPTITADGGYRAEAWGTPGSESVISQPATYTATYNKEDYTITYINVDGEDITFNGNTGNPNPGGYSVDSESFSLINPHKVGHVFDGWSGTAIGNGTSDLSKTVTITKGSTGNREYMAHFSKDNYDVIYDENKPQAATGSITDMPASPVKDIVFESSYTVAGEIPKLDGYRFMGWKATKDIDGVQDFIGGNSFKMPAENVTLQARWEKEYHVTYNGNNNTGGTVPSDAKSYINGESATVLDLGQDPIQKTNHVFDGWKIDGTGTLYNTGDALPAFGDADINLIAQWTPQWTVTYINSYINKGTMTPDPASEIVLDKASPVNIPDVAANSNAHKFIGWTSSVKGGIFTAEDIKTESITQDVTFTAQYSDIDRVTISYDFGGGQNANGDTRIPDSGYPGDATTKPVWNAIEAQSDFYRTGYTFTGWDETVPNTFAAEMDGKVYTAQWTAIEYTVTFNAGINGQLDDPTKAKETVAYNNSVTGVPVINPNSTWNFAGTWENSLDNKVYTGEEILSYRVTADVTFTAQYNRQDMATVRFEYNGGQNGNGQSFSQVSGYEGQTYSVPSDFNRAYYIFDGWELTKTTDTTGAAMGIFGSQNSETVYTAKWRPVTYTVTFLSGTNGTMSPATYSETVEHGKTVSTVPGITASENYNHTGWTRAAGSADSNIYNADQIKGYVVISNVIYTAQYEAIIIPPTPTPDPTPTPALPPGSNPTPLPDGTTTTVTTPVADLTTTIGTTITTVIETLSTPVPAPSTVIQSNETSPDAAVLDQVVDDEVPLAGRNSGWSLLSLLLGLMSLIIGIVTFVTLIRRKKYDEEEFEVFTVDEMGNVIEGEEPEEVITRRKEQSRRMRTLKVLTGITGLLPVVFFLILDNLSLPMVWINRWTPLIGTLFLINVAVLVVQIIVKSRKKDDDDEDDEIEGVTAG